MGESDGAVLAFQPHSAGTAHHDERVPAPVEQDDGLLAAIERGLRLLDQPAREELLLTGRLKLLPHVQQLDFRKWALVHALGHLDQAIPAALRILPTLE